MMLTKVHRLRATIPAPTVAYAQRFADLAYRGVREGGKMETIVDHLCAVRGPVPRHVDNHPGTAGYRVKGLVIRSDGHRLHSASLDAAGVTEGILLQKGDLYEIDIADAHWTTCPDDLSELIFSPYIMPDDGRKAKKLAHDMTWTLVAQAITAGRWAA